MTNKTVFSKEEVRCIKKRWLDNNKAAGLYDLIQIAGQAVLQSPEIQQLRKDVERYRWLKERMIAVDFDYGEPPCTALVFHMPSSAMSFSCSCDANIDAAMEVKP